MILKIAIFSFLLCAVYTEKSKINKESLFHYQGMLRVGSKYPVNHYSDTKFDADLHVLFQNNGDMWMSLDNVKFALFSGSENLDKNSHFHSLPESSEAITLPYIYHRYSNKTLRGISSHKNDHPWSRNIKIAIAELFYQDTRVMNEPARAFHWSDGFDYAVLRTKDSIYITKSKSRDPYRAYIIEETNEEIEIDEHFLMPSFTKITSEFATDEPKTLKKIDAINFINYSPLDGESEHFYVSVNQTVTFSENRVIHRTEIDKENMIYSEKDFDPNMYLSEPGSLTLQERKLDINMDLILKEAKASLMKIFNVLHKSHIILKKKSIDQEELVYFLIQKLKYLDEEHLNKLYSDVHEKKDLSRVLVEIISLVGTPASSSFIIDLVTQNKIEGDTVIDCLKNLPINSQDFPEKLKNELVKLVDDPKKINIRYQVILTLSNFISRNSNEIYENLVEDFIEKLKKSVNENDQLVYVYALRNIKSQKTYDEILKIARGSEDYRHLSPHAKAESLYGLKRTCKKKNILWLYLTDKNESFEVKAAAINILISLDNPMNFDKMAWILRSTETDDSEELNHLFYTKLERFSKIKMKKYVESSIRAREVLAYFKKPKIQFTRSSTFLYETVVDNNGGGSLLDVTFYGNFLEQNFTTIRVKQSIRFSSLVYDNKEYVLYSPDNAATIMRRLDENLIHLTETKNGRVLSFRTINIPHLMVVEPGILSYGEAYFVSQARKKEFRIPTDMGIPVVFRNNAEYIAKLKVQFIPDPSNEKAIFDSVYRNSETYGFSFYDPISSTWIGVERVKAFDANLNTHIEIVMEPSKIISKVILNLSDEPFGFQSFAYSHVYVKDHSDRKIISETCPECNSDNIVTNGKKETDVTFFEGDFEYTGHRYKMALFDCEDRNTVTHFTLKDMNALRKLIMSSQHPGSCGVGFMFKKSEKFPGTLTTISFKSGKTSNENQSFLTSNHNLIATCNLMNEEKLFKSWNMNFLLSENKPNWYRVKISTASSEEGLPNFKFCLDLTDTWSHDHFSSNWKMQIGKDDSNDECPINGSTIKVDLIGEASEEMKSLANFDNIYTVCESDASNDFKDCLREVSSFRSYIFNVTYNNLNENEIYFWKKISDAVRLLHAEKFERMKKSELELPENNLQIKVTYPLHYKSIDVSVLSRENAYRYDGIYLGDLYLLSLPAPRSSFMKYDFDMPDFCEIEKGYLTNHAYGSRKEFKYTNDWTTLAGLTRDNITIWAVNGKISKDSDDVVLQIEEKGDVVQLYYKDGFVVTVNQKPVELKSNTLTPIQNFVMLMTSKDGHNQRVFVKLSVKNIVVEYNPSRVRLSIESEYYGSCYS